MMQTYHPLTERIRKLLRENNIWFETYEHAPVHTSEEAAKVRKGYTISQGAKALILKVTLPTDEQRFVMFVLPGDKKLDNKKIKDLLQPKDIRFATEEEIANLTEGVQVGGIPPLGNLFGLEVFVDKSLLKHEKIIFNAGDRSFSIGMYSEDYLEFVIPKVEEFTS